MTTYRPPQTTRRRAVAAITAATAGILAAPAGIGWVRAARQDATPVTDAPAADGPAPIVLVHGAFLGAWCWDEVVPLLEAAGRTVAVPELPGHGEDRTPVAEVTLQGYVDRVLEAVDAQTAPVLLVGHSLAGTVISEVAEQRPDRVRALVYLAGYLLRDGESLLDAASADGDSLLGPALQIDQASGVATVRPDAIAPLFFHDCPPAVAERAATLAQARPEPLAPFATPIRTTPANFGRVPRFAIETLTDRVVSPSLQRRMRDAVPGGHVVAMASGHCPFLAQPDQLASLLTLL